MVKEYAALVKDKSVLENIFSIADEKNIPVCHNYRRETLEWKYAILVFKDDNTPDRIYGSNRRYDRKPTEELSLTEFLNKLNASYD